MKLAAIDIGSNAIRLQIVNVFESKDGDTMLALKVGLKDGIIYELYERTTGKNISEIEYISSI